LWFKTASSQLQDSFQWYQAGLIRQGCTFEGL